MSRSWIRINSSIADAVVRLGKVVRYVENPCISAATWPEASVVSYRALSRVCGTLSAISRS